MKVPEVSYWDLVDGDPPVELIGQIWNMLSIEGYLLLTDVSEAFPNVDDVWDAMGRYFALPVSVKALDHIALSDDHHGYVPMGEEGKTNEEADYKESYDCGWRIRKDDSGWPRTQGFSAAACLIWRQMHDVGERVARVFSTMFGQHPDFFASTATEAPSQLRLLNYTGDNPSRVSVDWHTDYELFTLLLTTKPGLEVRRTDESIVRVPCRDNSLVLTLGDLCEVVTNGALRASPHRVAPLAEARLSIAFFYALDWHTRVGPLPRFVHNNVRHYPDLVAGEHLLRRTDEGFAYRRRILSEAHTQDKGDESSSHFYEYRPSGRQNL